MRTRLNGFFVSDAEFIRRRFLAVLASRLVHRHDILHRRDGLQIVARRDDQAGAIAGQRLDHPLHLGAHVFHGAEGQRLLVVYR